MLLSGKVAVVTGASRGIGLAIAQSFARHGAQVVGCSIQGPFDGTSLLRCDVTKPDEVERFRDQVLARFGPPHLLVNNAGIVIRGSFEEQSLAEWNAVMDANLTSTFLVTRAFLPAQRRAAANALAGSFRIINIASIAGRQGTPMLSAYCAAKHGTVGLTRALAEELRSVGIPVNAICPGSVDTDMLKIGMPGGKPKMTAADVAAAALFLATLAPVAMTGACLDVFG